MIKKLFSADPKLIGPIECTPTTDALPASRVNGTPDPLKADLVALLVKSRCSTEPSILCDTHPTQARTGSCRGRGRTTDDRGHRKHLSLLPGIRKACHFPVPLGRA